MRKLLPCLAFFIIFCYFPMYGVQIAFRDYKAAFGITGSQWVGLKYFVRTLQLNSTPIATTRKEM